MAFSIVFDDSFRIFLGSHRIQRIPRTEKRGRRQTSFVNITEIVQHDNTAKLYDKDIKVDTYRASGKGGQHRNKTDSAVRMTHIPTGLVATATEHRSQHKNRVLARQRLAEKVTKHVAKNDEHVSLDAQWDWCSWRDEVTLPDGTKRSMSATLRKGLI